MTTENETNKERLQIFVEQADLNKIKQLQNKYKDSGLNVSVSNVARQCLLEGLRDK